MTASFLKIATRSGQAKALNAAMQNISQLQMNSANVSINLPPTSPPLPSQILGKAAHGTGRADPVGTSMQDCVASVLLSTQRWVAWVGVEVFYHSVKKKPSNSHTCLQGAPKLVCRWRSAYC